jgi:aspartate aminotransferase
VLFYTCSNVTSIVQFGGIGALEGPQDCVADYREELRVRRNLFYEGIREHATGVLSGRPPHGAFYAFLRINPGMAPAIPLPTSLSWSLAEHLIKAGRIGCVPGVDFGPRGEGYIRFCFARSRDELRGALESMGNLFRGGGAADSFKSSLASRQPRNGSS